ncbi:MAG: thioredoxin family protein [Betaproteobacteria bacterium]|nr:thioredoxin family protein [Betaproteobacteria bacterium]
MPPEASLAVFVKRDCPTCQLVEPIVRALSVRETAIEVYSQDDPGFPENLEAVVDDRELGASFRHGIEIVPTLIRFEDGKEVARTEGWDMKDWRRVTGIADLGEGLPPLRPGCGSKSVQPGVAEYLRVRFGDPGIKARKIEFGEYDDPVEVCFERGWSDGLPVVPPTDVRVLRMLQGTTRASDEVLGSIPPNLAECTVEKVAINAVMAGCKPEYMPVVLAALEAALEPVFTLHGLLATTYFSSPIIIVNGPVAKRIGMNSGLNALGQGNRANATIGRALQLIVRNVGGGRPGEVDRATLGGPGKYTFCFAEDESDPGWEPLSVSRGFAPGASTVTLFQGEGVQGFVDQKSRSPEDLARSLAMGLNAIGHPKMVSTQRAILVLSPEHYAIFSAAKWDRKRIEQAIHAATVRAGKDLIAGAQGVGEGIPASQAGEAVPKFFDGGLMIVRAGGPAGLFSAILPGWLAGRNRLELQPVTKEIKP